MEKQQLQQPAAIDTRVSASTKKKKKREFKNRKTFSLKAMEALTDKVSFLKTKYDELSVNAQEKLGYHYNEILNILLFHKYVKGNKKLFDVYKKIKDAINKGYEFETPKKKKKVQENKMGKVNKDSNFTHFAINKKTNKILESWNYQGYDQDELKTFKNEYFLNTINFEYPYIDKKDVIIVKKDSLEKRNLNESVKGDWEKNNYTHFAVLKETNHILHGFNYSNIDQKQLNENKKEFFLEEISRVYGNEIKPSEIKVIKADKFEKDYKKKNNWVGLINEAFCGKIEEEETLNESTAMGGGANGGVFGPEGMPVANPRMKPKRGFSMKKKQNMFDKPSNDLGGLDDFYSRWSHPAFKKSKGAVKVDKKSGRVTPNTKTHYSGTKIKVKGVNESTQSLVDLDALMNDDITYIKMEKSIVSNNNNKVELLRENNRESIIEFLMDKQGTLLPEVYSKKQFNSLSLKTLNEYYSRVVQKLELKEEIKPSALTNIEGLKNQNKNNSNSYYKKDASNKTTTMLVQKGEGDGLVYDKDSLERKDIPKYDYQSEHQQEYLKKVHRGLEHVKPENAPNGEPNAKWEARKKELMSYTDSGKEAYDAANKANEFKDANKLGTGRGRAVLNQKDLPAVKKEDKVLKENSKFTLVKENNILDQIQSFYIDDENRKKPIIFDSNEIVETFNESKLNGCKELMYKGLGQTLSETFKNKVLNRKLLYSPESKKVYLV